MSVPATPFTPSIVSSTKVDASTAQAVIQWYAVVETGGRPLTGYKVYANRVSSGAESLVYDGTDKPEVLTATITGLILDADYDLYLTALNPLESARSPALRLRAAGLPDAPGAITEIPVSRTGSSIGLQWLVPTSDGGSPILSYTLVQVIENEQDKVFYFGTSLLTTVVK